MNKWIKTFNLYVHDVFPQGGARPTRPSRGFLVCEDEDLYYSTTGGNADIANLLVNDMQLGGWVASLAR